MGGDAQEINYESDTKYEADELDFSNMQVRSGSLDTSTTAYEEAEDTSEVDNANADIAEKSFIEEMQNTVKSQQDQIDKMQEYMQREPQQQEQPQDQFTFDEMPDPYNYIKLDEGQQEQFRIGGTYKIHKNEKRDEKHLLEGLPTNRYESQRGQAGTKLRSEEGYEKEIIQQGTTDNERAFLGEFKRGGIIKDQQGQRKYPNQITEIQGNTMATDGYGDIPLWTVPDVGEPRMVFPNTGEHVFPGATKFTEYPQFQVGGQQELPKKSELDFTKIKDNNPGLVKGQGIFVDGTFISPDNELEEVVIQRNNKQAPSKKFSYKRNNSEMLQETVKDVIPTFQVPDVAKEQRKITYKERQVDNLKVKAESTMERRSNNLDLEEVGDTINYDTIKSTDNILSVQKKLKGLGYNLNPNKKFSNDGIDGKMGAVTKAAIEDYNEKGEAGVYTSYKTQEGKLGVCKETHCSEFAQNEVFRNMKPNVSREEWNSLTGLTGPAWGIGKNIEKAGGKKIKQNELKAGDFITMYTGTQTYMAQAKAAGTDATHVGIVDKVNPDGSYYVLHNSHGSYGKDKNGKTIYKGVEYRDLVTNGVVSGLNYSVRDSYRPNYGSVKDYEKKKEVRTNTSLTVDPNKINELQKLDGSYFGSDMKKEVETFSKSINTLENKQVMSSKHNLGEDEYQSLAKATLGILAQESKFGTSKALGPKRFAAGISKAFGELIPKTAENILNAATTEIFNKKYIKSDEISRGAGQIKYATNYGDSDLTEFGINSKNFSKESNISLVVLDRLSNHYKGLINKGVSKKEAMYQAIEKYNKGRVTDYGKNLDSDYASKVINFASIFTVKDDKNKEYNTILDGLSTESNILKKKKI
jgi:hypothetical protein